jgi:hypothetical protein
MPTAILTDVRLGAHTGFERVVFEFRDHVPGYAVRYIERPVTEDGSGREVTVAGDSVLSVRLESAAAHDDAGKTTFNRSLGNPDGTVKQVSSTGDFEGVLNWVMGVRGRPKFKVFESEGTKLVIDVDASG